MQELKGRVATDDGITLVELMVSIFVLGILLAALVGGITTSLQAVANNQREARAIALQNEMVERFETLQWEELTVRCDAGGDHPWDTDADAEDDVVGGDVVPCDNDVASFAPTALETRGEGDRQFQVETHVVFVDRDDSAAEKETKQVVSFVRWESAAGQARETTVSAERGPPAKSVGFVPESVDKDFDNIADASDNCPDTPNGNQDDTVGPYDTTGDGVPDLASPLGAPDGVGNACDADGDGHRNNVDTCPNNFNWDQSDTSACATTPPAGPAPVVNTLEIHRWTGTTWVSTSGRLCVDPGDALAAPHRIRVQILHLPRNDGDVNMRIGKWKGGKNTVTPNDDDLREAVYTGDDFTHTWSAFLEQSLGRFRDGRNTYVEVDADRPSDGASDSKTFTPVPVVPIGACT